MRLGVPKETSAEENRVALVPDTVARLVKAGFEIVIETGAGVRAYFADEAYQRAGAAILPDAAAVFAQAEIVLKVQRPSIEEAGMLPSGCVVVALMQPAASTELMALLAERGVTALAMELLPRISAAQAMDVLSSQATVAGYKAALLGAVTIGRLMPMMITAAGTLIPSSVLVLGAGVAGLQAIATARRLGAQVAAFDIRAASRQEVESLGAHFIETEQAPANVESAGGYARELAQDEQRRVLQTIGRHIGEADLVITTAQVPGRTAPRLITAEMVAAMKPGSVIVDLAADTGGNCELTQLDRTVQSNGVSILGPRNLAATVPTHASQMYSRNMQSLVQYMVRDQKLMLELDDRIVGPMAITHQGLVRYPADASRTAA